MTSLGIPRWRTTPDGTVDAVRTAEHWQPEGDAVRCTLCYRDCLLKEGEAGTCGFRSNHGGEMKLDSHGVISSAVRQLRAYGPDPFLTYKPGQTCLFFGGIQCTAACTFCMSAQIVHKPEAVSWGVPPSQTIPRPDRKGPSRWYGMRAYMHPEVAVENAIMQGVESILFGINEPTLSFEWTLDVARLAKRNKLDVLIETNGFTDPAAIDQLAPFVDAVDVGVKGSADPDFYARVMRSPGAVPHVMESLSRWRASDAHLIVGDLVALPRHQDDVTFEEAAKRFYSEVLDRCGPITAVLTTGIKRPGPIDGKFAFEDDPIYDAGGDAEDRVFRALDLAHEAGLKFAHTKEGPDQEWCCPECSGVLLALHERCGAGLAQNGLRPGEDCVMATSYCPFWTHEQHVTDSRCDHCSTDVPIVTLSTNQLERERSRVRRNTEHLSTLR